MSWVYFKPHNEIVENPPDEPAELVFGALDDEIRHQDYWQKLHECRTIPMRGNPNWEHKQIVIEGKDFEIRHNTHWTNDETVAIPLSSKESEDDKKKIREAVIKKIIDDNLDYLELKEGQRFWVEYIIRKAIRIYMKELKGITT